MEKNTQNSKKLNTFIVIYAIVAVFCLILYFYTIFLYSKKAISSFLNKKNKGLESVTYTSKVKKPINLKDINVNEEDITMTDEDFSQVINTLYTSGFIADSNLEEVKDKTVINIDFESKINGESFDGGSATNYYLFVDLEEDSDPNGYAAQIIGHKLNETFEINLKIPETEENKSIAGQIATTTVTINQINEPIINDDFVKNNQRMLSYFVLSNTSQYFSPSEFTSAKKFKEIMGKAYKNNALLADIEDDLVAGTSYNIDSDEKNKYVEKEKKEYTEMAESMGYTFEDFLAKYSLDEDDFNIQVIKNFELNILFNYYIEKENIHVTQKEYEEITELIIEFSNGAYINLTAYEKENPKKESVQKILYNKLYDYILDNITVNEIASSGEVN